jgi:hypothetical protein
MTEALQRWEWAARATLADRGIGYYAASEVLAQVRVFCSTSGRSPLGAFGPPRQWASAVADDVMPHAMARR